MTIYRTGITVGYARWSLTIKTEKAIESSTSSRVYDHIQQQLKMLLIQSVNLQVGLLEDRSERIRNL